MGQPAWLEAVYLAAVGGIAVVLPACLLAGYFAWSPASYIGLLFMTIPVVVILWLCALFGRAHLKRKRDE
jgi:hypothetical protein